MTTSTRLVQTSRLNTLVREAGDPSTKTIDATRGMADFSDDIAALRRTWSTRSVVLTTCATS